MDDREMILNPRRWPLLVLPLKRHVPGKGVEPAFLALPLKVLKVSDNEPITIYLGTMFEKRSLLPTKTYANVDELLADGWVVD